MNTHAHKVLKKKEHDFENWQITQLSTPEDWKSHFFYTILMLNIFWPPPQSARTFIYNSGTKASVCIWTDHAAVGPHKNYAISFTCHGQSTLNFWLYYLKIICAGGYVHVVSGNGIDQNFLVVMVTYNQNVLHMGQMMFSGTNKCGIQICFCVYVSHLFVIHMHVWPIV